MLEYAGEFEVHLTARTDDPNAAKFRKWCDENALKCVRIVLSRGDHPEQPMATWRRPATDLSTVLKEAKEFAASAASEGHDVVRVKVETPLTNQDVPQEDSVAATRSETNYFEHHLKLRRPVEAPLDDLHQVCEAHGAHLSRNAFAQTDLGRFEHRFVTLRSYGVGAMTSNDQVQLLLADLNRIHQEVIEKESEYCVYDSNLELDAGWLPATGTVNKVPANPNS